MAIKTLLVAVGRDESDTGRTERVARAVSEVAGPTGARVILLHVFGEDELSTLIEQLDFEEPGDADANAVARRHSATRAIGDVLQTDGIGFEVRGEVGSDPGSTVVAAAEELDADRVVVGGSGRTPAGKAVFGSDAQHVLINAHCPVTYVRA